MVEVYFYMPVNEVQNAVECGMKLSQWFDKEVQINGQNRKCIAAFLNPKDDMDKYKSADLKCVKLQLDAKYCFVGDKFLYQVGVNIPKALELFNQSIIPIEKYIFGSYRIPECLVLSTIIAGQIEVLDKRLDSPVLFGNSEELYINNIIETYREEYDDFNDAVLYSFYCKLVDAGKMEIIEDSDKKIAVFIDKEKGKNYTIMVPDLRKY
jgi:hypothetical protein